MFAMGSGETRGGQMSRHDTKLTQNQKNLALQPLASSVSPTCLAALQSPIEYQRREGKSNSLGRCMRPPLSASSALRPHSSASIDRHKLPSLHSHNTSLPALYLPSQGHSRGHSRGSSETDSLHDVGLTPQLQ